MAHRTRTPAARRILTSACALLVAVGLAGCGSTTGAAKQAALDPQVIKAGTLTVCTSLGYPPFEFNQDGQPAGFDIDLAKEVAKQLQLKPVFINANFNAIQSGQLLNDGRCDVAVAGISINGERARVLDFSSPYFNTGQAMVVKSTSEATSLDDLGGEKIGVQKGTTSELFLTDNAPKNATIVPLTTPGDVTDAIRKGDVAAGVYDNTVVGDVIERNPKLEVVAEFDTGEQYGMAVKKDSSVDLLRFINNVLAKLKSGDGYDAIYNRWFGGATTP
ncbi:MAG TPA: ABC transporter substrate-binding protein [Nocardioidaceae bacterium]|nr:ABC transporter substrate-binding protein [Nocardioidaceae bacterium]